jgi:hypothetical protein
MSKKSQKHKPTLVDIVKRSISLASDDATFDELYHILEEDWLNGAKSYHIPIIIFKDREFIDPTKSEEREIPAHLRHQLFNTLPEGHNAGKRFNNGDVALILINADVRENLRGKNRIVAAYYIDEQEVRQ